MSFSFICSPAPILDYLDRHNAEPIPFFWTKTVAVIPEQETRARDKLQAIKSGNDATESKHQLRAVATCASLRLLRPSPTKFRRPAFVGYRAYHVAVRQAFC